MNSALVKELFGDEGHRFLNVIDGVIASIQTPPTYTFLPQDEYGRLLEKDLTQGMQVYWKEILYRSHIASLASMCRHRKWVSGILDAAEKPNVFAFAATCRGLLESVADAAYSVIPIWINLAGNFPMIHRAVKGEVKELAISQELENVLLHFTDATKKSKVIGNRDVYEAKPISQYLDQLAKDRKPLVDACYSELCDLTHPGMLSVRLFFSFQTEDEDRWQFNSGRDEEFIHYFAAKYRSLFSDLLPVGFNPSLLAFRVINHFCLSELSVARVDDLCFDNIKVWRDYSTMLPIREITNAAGIALDLDSTDARRTSTSVQGADTPRVGRNSPCPCGSGKKFKNCCLKRT